jgi:hypothetical protein
MWQNVANSFQLAHFSTDLAGQNHKWPKQMGTFLTTMMAILPPTSPTTVIGGFSLAIITEKEERTGHC